MGTDSRRTVWDGSLVQQNAGKERKPRCRPLFPPVVLVLWVDLGISEYGGQDGRSIHFRLSIRMDILGCYHAKDKPPPPKPIEALEVPDMSFPAPAKGERFADWQGARHLCTLACPKFSIWLGRCLWVGILEAALVCICWRKKFYFKASEGVGEYRIISLIPLIFAFLPHYKHQQFISCSLPFSYLNQVSLAFACMSWGSSFSPALPGAYSTLEEKDTPLLGFETVVQHFTLLWERSLHWI